MKAEEHHRLEKNVLAEKLTTIAEKAKEGQLLNFRLVAFLIIVVVGGGLWWYLTRETSRASSIAWQTVDGMTSADMLKDFAKEHPDTMPGKVARLQYARLLIAPEGLDLLRNPEKRKQGIENIELARAEFARLVEEFKNDLTLHAQALDGLAHAELALVGIPDEKTGKDRGDILKAVEYFREMGKLVGENTELGKRMLDKAQTLESKKAEVLQVAKDLNERMSPPPLAPDIKLPDSLTPKLDKPAGDAGEIKSPSIPPPSPPAGSVPATAVPPPVKSATENPSPSPEPTKPDPNKKP